MLVLFVFVVVALCSAQQFPSYVHGSQGRARFQRLARDVAKVGVSRQQMLHPKAALAKKKKATKKKSAPAAAPSWWTRVKKRVGTGASKLAKQAKSAHKAAGRTVLKTFNKGLGHTANLVRKVDGVVAKGIGMAVGGVMNGHAAAKKWTTRQLMKSKTGVHVYHSLRKMRESAGQSKTMQFVKRHAKRAGSAVASQWKNAKQTGAKVWGKAQNGYANLGERYGIDRAESKQAMNDLGRTAIGVVSYVPVFKAGQMAGQTAVQAGRMAMAARAAAKSRMAAQTSGKVASRTNDALTYENVVNQQLEARRAQQQQQALLAQQYPAGPQAPPQPQYQMPART